MKEVLHVRNIFYSKKDGFLLSNEVKDAELYINKFSVQKSNTYTKTLEQPLIVMDTVHSCFVHGIVDSIFSAYWIKYDIMKNMPELGENFGVFVRKGDVEKYPEQNLKNIDEENSRFKGVYDELMDLVTTKKIVFEHLMDENEVYLIKDCFFTKLDTQNQRSLWNRGEDYPGRNLGEKVFDDDHIQRMINLYIQDILNIYGLEKNTESLKKNIVIVDRKTEYRSLAKTWLHDEVGEDVSEMPSLLDKLDIFLSTQPLLNYNGIVYLEDLSMKEQMECFLKNDIIITPHGANMVHGLWSNKKIIIEVLYDEKKAGMYKRIMSFTNNKLAQISPYQIYDFVKLLVMRFKNNTGPTVTEVN
jgi:hypothetical protein